MRSHTLRGAVVLLVGVFVVAVAPAAWAADPWSDTTQPPAQRANELLAAMSFDQKVQLALNNFAAVASFGVPALANFDGPSGVRTTGTTSFPSSQTLAASFDRALAYDYTTVMGLTVFFAVLVVAGNLVADVLYAVLDPRIRYR